MILLFLYPSILVLAVASLHINYLVHHLTQFDRVVRFFLWYVLAHIVHAVTFRELFPEYVYVDKAAPFGLMYGPLLFFGYKTSKGNILTKKSILIHVAPFLFALPWYIYFLLSSSFRDFYSMVYYGCLYGPMAFLWLGYALWTIYKESRRREGNMTASKSLTSLSSIILFTLAIFFILLVFTRTFNGIPSQAETTGVFVFMTMLGAVVFVYMHSVNRLMSQQGSTNYGEQSTPNSSYHKSSVSKVLMETYQKKAKHYIDAGYYLDADLSLDKMASELKIPKHHLSQLFSQYFGQSFLKYINSLRIKHACSILETSQFMPSIENLAEKCGFKSRASFYRNFNSEMNCTPSEYREKARNYSL